MCGAERPAGKALTTPVQRREPAFKAMQNQEFLQLLVCDLVDVDPKTVLRQRFADHPEIRKKVRAR